MFGICLENAGEETDFLSVRIVRIAIDWKLILGEKHLLPKFSNKWLKQLFALVALSQWYDFLSSMLFRDMKFRFVYLKIS